MSIHYNQSYTLKQINKILRVIKECIGKDNFIISLNENRQENRDFIAEYNLNRYRRKEILLEVETTDFCHSLRNKKVGYSHEVLYVFVTKRKLINYEGEEEIIDIYIKFNLIKYKNGKKTIVVSFHKRNKPISYCFKER